MTSIEFTLWLKGFMTACNEYSPTPKQWDIIKEELDKVSDNVGTPIGIGGWGTPNMAPITPCNWPLHTDPYNPYKVYCGDAPAGTAPLNPAVTTNIPPYTTGPDNSNFKITTTPGTTGYVTIHNPIQFGFTGSATYNPWTTTQWNPSGSYWSYTNGGNNIKE
jgi:hypothetical protein